MKKFKLITYFVSVLSLLFVVTEANGSGIFKLRDYAEAVSTNDVQRIKVLRSYILGAVETHFLYSKMLRDWTNINILCTGNNKLNINELGAIFELKIMTLRRRYGEDIMDMPITKAVQMVVEEQYKCH
ncbi:MAG: hypothetical protein HOC92_20555 [Gammaproteobacteria bacterium]|jgi:hypothetical protein|nr:hypothetical protein [Gammaproteobacteria bacterium]MBT4452103.1 hypothetical protein [Gammaproteobacteria bacterium]